MPIAFLSAPVLAILVLLWPATPASAAAPCMLNWAMPGEYFVSGNFRGTRESAVVRLSHGCRVYIDIPGTYSGGPVRQTGACLSFNFRVDDVRETFVATWCDDHAVVPWQGRTITASVSPLPRD